ncbi:hypothetical protein APR51_03500 [Variovorax paradoxus]|nr:hypothetical protein APR51_03500 [Variovorax paradoxus]
MRQHDLQHLLALAVAIDLADLAQRLRRLPEALQRVERHRHQRCLGDQDVLERLADAHDQQHEGQPGQHRDLHQRVEARQQVGLDAARQAHGRAQQQPEQRADREAHAHARETGAHVQPEVAAGREVAQRLGHELGRRQHLRRDPALAGTHEPQREQCGGQQPGQGGVAEAAPLQREAQRRDLLALQDRRQFGFGAHRDATAGPAFGCPFASKALQ